MKIYIDNCVYNRPFDDFRKQERIFLEAMSFYMILVWIEQGRIETVHSDALEYEKDHILDPERKLRIERYFSMASEYINISDDTIKRAEELKEIGLKDMDALHVALAEESDAEYFVTCDDFIIKCGRQNKDKINSHRWNNRIYWRYDI